MVKMHASVILCFLVVTLPTECALPPGYVFPPNQTYDAFIRDVRVSHGDFEVFASSQLGAVSPFLDSARHPIFVQSDVLNATFQTATPIPGSASFFVAPPANSLNNFLGKQFYDTWYMDYPMVNIRFPCSLTLKAIDLNGTYQIDYASYTGSSGRQYFPINGRGWGNDVQHDWNGIGASGNSYGLANNFGNTLETHLSFLYQGREVFSFVGDDDVWVFVNNQIVIDMGGVHSEEGAQVNLTQVAPIIGLEIGGTYNFDFYLAERHTTASNFRITSSIIPLREPPQAFADVFLVAVGAVLTQDFRCSSKYFYPLSVFLSSEPSFGTIQIFNGTSSSDLPSFTFTSMVNGTTTIYFYVYDGFLKSNITNITITVFDVPTPAPPLPVPPPVFVAQQLSTPAIVGIVVGSVLAVAAVIAAIVLFCVLRNRIGVWADEINSDVFADVPMNPLYADAFKPTDNPLFNTDTLA